MKATKLDLDSYLRADYPLLYAQTDEEQRLIATVYAECGDTALYRWDVASQAITKVQSKANGTTQDALKAITPQHALQAVSQLPDNSILMLLDFHHYLKAPDVSRMLKNLIPHLKKTHKHILIASPILVIPPELEKLVNLLDLPLPDVDELKAISARLIAQYENTNPDCKVVWKAEDVAYAKGLTAPEAENAMARSLAMAGTIDPKILEEEKLQAVKKSGVMTLYPPESPDALQGLDPLKAYIQSRRRAFTDPRLPRPKGVLLYGPPGTGKSLSCKVIASVFGFPLFAVGPDAFRGGIYGETEKKTRGIWKMARASAPCILWIDEIEKVFGGAQSSNRTDGGAGSASLAIMLNEMEECTETVYLVATCNDIDELLALSQGAMLRRFDDVFFVDLPGADERPQILEYMCRKYRIDGKDLSGKLPRMDGWSGGEIEKFVKAAIFDGPDEAARHIHPVYHQNRDAIDRARAWGESNARPANKVQVSQESLIDDLLTRKVRTKKGETL